MIRACRCPPRLAGCRSTIGADSAACATRMKALEQELLALLQAEPGPELRAMLQSRFQVSGAAEEQVVHCFCGLVRKEFAKN